MSSILKALRKLEEEKAALGEGGVDLARDILKRSAPQRNIGSPLILKVVFFGVLAIALVAGLWLMLSSIGPVTTTVAPTPVETVQRKPIIVPAPEKKISRTVKPAKITPPEPKVVKVEKAPVIVVPPEPEVGIVKIEKVVVSGSVKPEPALPTDLPELWVSAIAFKPLPGERLAVVNDLPVMEGTSIDGVQIVEILKESVRFSWQGMELVLPLIEEVSP